MIAVGLESLRHLATKETVVARVLLNGGAYSRKTIRFKRGLWRVTNHIDDTKQVLTDEQLWTDSIIGKALDAGALLVEEER